MKSDDKGSLIVIVAAIAVYSIFMGIAFLVGG